jgi:hypothetical protein
VNNTVRGSARVNRDDFDDVVPRHLDHELRLIREAIAMVASGRSRRIVLASLHFGGELLPRAEALAASAGVKAYGNWTLDRHLHSIVVEMAERHGE